MRNKENSCCCRPCPPSPAPGYPGIGRLYGRLTIPYCNHKPNEPPIDIPEDYIIIPKAFDDQIVATEGKTIEHDLLVKAVPYYETTNNSEGLTAYIAEEV